jgi:hypothetical protein
MSQSQLAKKLTDYVHSINEAKKVSPFYGRVLALDPGETTGFAVFDSRPDGVGETAKARLVDWMEINQIKTWPERDCVQNLTALFDRIRPTILVYESYRVYDWKSDDHKWSPVHTTQVIGSIWTLAIQRSIPRCEQSAQNAKGFWTDDRLKDYGIYLKAVKHGRDATRHAMHFLCFGNKEISK